MRIIISKMAPSEYDPVILAAWQCHQKDWPCGSSYHRFLLMRASKTERGRWLLDNCAHTKIEEYAVSPELMTVEIYLVGDLEDGRLVTEYMLKFSGRKE